MKIQCCSLEIISVSGNTDFFSLILLQISLQISTIIWNTSFEKKKLHDFSLNKNEVRQIALLLENFSSYVKKTQIDLRKTRHLYTPQYSRNIKLFM